MNKKLLFIVALLAVAAVALAVGYMVPKEPQPKIVLKEYRGAKISADAPAGIPPVFLDGKDAISPTYAEKNSAIYATFGTKKSGADIVALFEKDFSSLGWVVDKKEDSGSPYIRAHDPKGTASLEVMAPVGPSGATEVTLTYVK